MENYDVIEMYRKVMGGNIKRRRKALKMTQDDLAIAAGFSDKSAISKIESGKCGISGDSMINIASALDMDASELMSLEQKGQISDHFSDFATKIAEIVDSLPSDEKRQMLYDVVKIFAEVK